MPELEVRVMPDGTGEVSSTLVVLMSSIGIRFTSESEHLHKFAIWLVVGMSEASRPASIHVVICSWSFSTCDELRTAQREARHEATDLSEKRRSAVRDRCFSAGSIG